MSDEARRAAGDIRRRAVSFKQQPSPDIVGHGFSFQSATKTDHERWRCHIRAPRPFLSFRVVLGQARKFQCEEEEEADLMAVYIPLPAA
jgi:hypothetical protein